MIEDLYGIVTDRRERRAQWGNRVAHGKVCATIWRAVAVAPGPRPPPAAILAAEPLRIRGRNKKFGNPDHGLAERIRTAGNLCNVAISDARERQMTMQSTIYLIYARARVGMTMVADMYGYADHTGARPSIRAVRDRMARAITVADEEARQERIMTAASAA